MFARSAKATGLFYVSVHDQGAITAARPSIQRWGDRCDTHLKPYTQAEAAALGLGLQGASAKTTTRRYRTHCVFRYSHPICTASCSLRSVDMTGGDQFCELTLATQTGISRKTKAAHRPRITPTKKFQRHDPSALLDCASWSGSCSMAGSTSSSAKPALH